MSRSHENAENDVSCLKTHSRVARGKYRFRVDGSNSLETQTFESDWSCDLSPSPLSFETLKKLSRHAQCKVGSVFSHMYRVDG